MADLTLGPNGKIEAHSHDYYEFFVVLEGCFYEIVDSVATYYPVGAGRIVSKECYHYLENAYQGTSTLRNIAIRRDLFQAHLCQCIGQREHLFTKFQYEEAMSTIYQKKTTVAEELSPMDASFTFIMNGVVNDLLFYVLLQQTDYEVPLWLRELEEQMKQPENFVGGLEVMRELAGCTPSYLNRIFKRYYKKTPTEFINQQRLLYAAKLLKDSEFTILQIVYECGFDNVSYFNRRFRAYYGTSPREYRNQKKIFFGSI